MNKIVALGPGKSSLDFKNDESYDVLAFQSTFPHCIEHIGVFPKYWVAGDPYAYVEGFQYLLKNKEQFKNKDLEILLPETFLQDLMTYRKSFGTTPLMRMPNGWDNFRNLIKEVSKYYRLKTIPTITTKYLELHEKKDSELKLIFDEGQEFIRFMTDKIVFGTVKFDSESVIGSKFKWGLENKLTSNVLPICYHLKAKKVKVYGFDYQGPRFYSDVARHPWNDETQTGNEVLEFSLKILERWVEWKSIHGMEIVSGTQDKVSLPNRFLTQEV